MFASALEQFEIIPLIPLRRGSFDLSLTNSSLRMVIVVAVLVGASRAVTVAGSGMVVPTRRQSVLESVHARIRTMIGQTLGVAGLPYAPFLFALFTFILGCNLIGLIPYSFTVTSHLAVTRTLALGIWIWKLFVGFRLHGMALFSLFRPQGIPFWLVPMIVPLELLGFTITFISLSVRLFANMLAGHILLKVIAGFAWTMMMAGGVRWVAHFVPLAVLFRLRGLETAVAFIQAYVFTLLTCIYLTDAIHGGH